MAYASYKTWAAFKSNTSVSLPRYFTLRLDGFLENAMGVNNTSGVTHVYSAGSEEDIVVSGLTMDTWFAGADEVANFGA